MDVCVCICTCPQICLSSNMFRSRLASLAWRQLHRQTIDFPAHSIGPRATVCHQAALSLFSVSQPPGGNGPEALKGFIRWESSNWEGRRERARRRQLPTERRKLPSVENENAIQPAETVASDVQVSSVVNHPALIITRAIEWGTVLLGFEQANKYNVLDQNGQTVALIAEDVTGIGNAIGRQVLRTRRNFTATVFNADGTQVVFRIRRPMYLISSTMYVEDGEGEVIGEIRQRWHLYKRNYDLYLDKTQFAEIAGTFLAWEFELKDAEGGTLALIDRNFQGFGKELFTDAGKYVIHFGQKPDDAAKQVTETLQSRTKDPSLPPVTPIAQMRTDVEVIPSYSGNQLVVSRKLQLSERMLALACAMTIDFDYFSHHSHSGGWLTPPLIIPMGGSGGEAPVEEATSQGASATAGEGDQAGSQGTSTGEEFSNESGGEWLDSGETGSADSAGFFDDAGGGDADGGSFWGGISDLLRDS